jgi:hypothetical protein
MEGWRRPAPRSRLTAVGGPPLPHPRVPHRCAGGAGVGPADRAPRRAPPYRGVRGVRGSTVGARTPRMRALRGLVRGSVGRWSRLALRRDDPPRG